MAGLSEHVAMIDCVVEGCEGTIAVEFGCKMATDGSSDLTICPTGMELLGEHLNEHPELWMQGEPH